VESEANRPSQKSFLRGFYGWCVLYELPFFDDDFYDYYLEVKKFGSDEGKGKDVIIDLPNRGPLKVNELKNFKESISILNIAVMSCQQLQGLIGLKLGQILGARDIQVIKLQFKHYKKTSEGTQFIELPRAKQRGSKNNKVTKRRPITKSLATLIDELKNRYERLANSPVLGEWHLICNLVSKGSKVESIPTGIRVLPITYRNKVKAIEKVLDLGFIVTNRRLRKTFCTQLIAKGTPLKVVAELMDHSDLQQLEVYYRHTHHIAQKLNDVLMQEADDIIDAFAGKIVTKEEVSQKGQEIFAQAEGQGLHLIGSCASRTPCALNPPLSCYGCSSLEAFEDADHKAVVETFVNESKRVFGKQHAIEILQHDDYLAASKFVQMLERGEL
jgi:integrase